MTTIAVRDGKMAADCGQNGGGIRRGTINKIERINGILVACCGYASEIEEFSAWLKKGKVDEERPKFDKSEDFSALTLDAKGVNVWNWKCWGQPLEAPFYAMGSGNEIAMGAMGAGASAEQAVKIACELDIYSDLPVQVEKL